MFDPGRAVLITKSADSYQEIDQLIAEAGLDPAAETRPSLYQSCHSGTIIEIEDQTISYPAVQPTQHGKGAVLERGTGETARAVASTCAVSVARACPADLGL